MEIRFNKWMLVLISCLLTSPAMAGDKWNSSLTISVGKSKTTNSCESPPLLFYATSGDECQEGGRIYRFAYNYKFSPFWGLELSAGDIGSAKANGTISASSAPSPVGAPYDWELKANGIALSGVGSLWLGKSLSIFGKVGAVRAHLKEELIAHDVGGDLILVSFNGVVPTNFKKNSLTYGVGLQVELSTAFAMRVQYENFGTYDIYSVYNLSKPEPISLTLISAGLVLKF